MRTTDKIIAGTIFWLITCFVLSACSATSVTDASVDSENGNSGYSSYTRYVDRLLEGFEPNGFQMLNSPSDIYGIEFPQNVYFEETNDLLGGDSLKPMNRKAIYSNADKDLLVCATFLYSEEKLPKRMLTIDTLPEEAISALDGLNGSTLREAYEIVLEEQHCITLLKFVSTETLCADREQEIDLYRQTVVGFFEEYTAFLKEQTNAG